MIALRRLSTWGALLSFAGIVAVASAQAPVTELDRQLDRVTLGINGMGVFTKSTSGPDHTFNQNVTDTPGNTAGALIELRYIKSPLVGLEFNFTYARYLQTYTGPHIQTFAEYPLGIQANASEYSLGWVFHTPKVLGIGTFVSAGGGSTAFKPTKGGGQNVTEQARATFYYNAGFEQQVISPHFGLRASIRQAFYLAPDFQQNYLTNLQRTYTVEPTAGFYLHF
jgi:hypothetical protein